MLYTEEREYIYIYIYLEVIIKQQCVYAFAKMLFSFMPSNKNTWWRGTTEAFLLMRTH